jgi:putative membrane protein
MMWGYGPDMGWMWLWGVLMLLGVALLVLVAVRLFAGGRGGFQGSGFQGSGFNPPGQPGAGHPGPGGPWPGRSRARQILDERFAKGELSADEYREQIKVLGEEP